VRGIAEILGSLLKQGANATVRRGDTNVTKKAATEAAAY
jgi:hypothetical protein